MAPASNEEQFKFLISCIRYSNNGKVDFGQVAQECKIVSKGAAAKRYERMMRAHGIAANAAAIKPAPARSVKSDRSESTGTQPKKRKVDGFVEDNSATDDDEGFANIKQDHAKEEEQFRVKEELSGLPNLCDATNLMQYYDPPSYNASQLGGEQDYPGSEYDTGSAGYGTPLGNYGLQGQQSYDFGSPCGYADTNSIQRAPGHDNDYQPMMPSPIETQGRPESPLIVE